MMARRGLRVGRGARWVQHLASTCHRRLAAWCNPANDSGPPRPAPADGPSAPEFDGAAKRRPPARNGTHSLHGIARSPPSARLLITLSNAKVVNTLIVKITLHQGAWPLTCEYFLKWGGRDLNPRPDSSTNAGIACFAQR
jgi:hypothetical protein